MLKRNQKLNKNSSERSLNRPTSANSKSKLTQRSKDTAKSRSTRASPRVDLPFKSKKEVAGKLLKPSRMPHRRNCSDSNKSLGKLKKSTSKPSILHSRANSQESLMTTDESDTLSHFISQYFAKHNSEPSTTLDFYRIGKLIGKGAFGKVMLGVHKLTGMNVAIKAIKKSYLQQEKNQRKVRQEIMILKKIQHEYIVRILEVFESPNHLLIVMEYMGGGDMFKYIKIKGRISEEEARPFFWQILKGAMVIHSHGILHRDFKLDNILMNSHYNSIKICDFGVSKIVKKGRIIREQCGTPAYLAPEIIADRGYEGFSVDIWSLGVLFYIMICGTIPFKANNLTDLHKAILQGVYKLPTFLSHSAKDLISKMLKLVPSNRISIADALEHPWFTDHEGWNSQEVDDKTALKFDEFLISKVEGFGFPREFLVKSLQNGDMNYATTSYHLLHNAIY